MSQSIKLNNYPFKGWDWAELAVCWNVPYEDIRIDWDDNEAIKDLINWDDSVYITNFLAGCFMYNEDSRVLRRICKDLRLYLAKLSESDISCWTEIWKAMSNMPEEHNYTLLQATHALIGHMWD